MKDNTSTPDLALVCSLCLGLTTSASLSFPICEMKIPKYSVYLTEFPVPEKLMYTKYMEVLWETKMHHRIFLDYCYHKKALAKSILIKLISYTELVKDQISSRELFTRDTDKSQAY